MSQRGVVPFLNKVVADTSIMDQVKELAKTSDDPAAAISNYAAELGFDVTGSEFTKMVDQLAKVESGELSLDELEVVAGGTAVIQQGMEGYLEDLNLQQDMQSQNRQFTVVSNSMKVKHDIEKCAINNVR